ncbi:MAG: ribosomal-protein-alanine N-acetyltransferase [SAR202 cluster bacterium]|nr:ribosomal-protein-alanine N-acetyltransferase [SAR202 cluster bacterium]
MNAQTALDITESVAPGVFIASDTRYAVRAAEQSDVVGLARVEHESFPEQWPPTNFPREIRKANTAYLVAIAGEGSALLRAAEPSDEAADHGAAVEAHPRPQARALWRLLHGARRLAFQPPTRTVPHDPGPRHVAGYVAIWFVVDEAHIVSIGVRASERRRGVGELLLLCAFDVAHRRHMKELTLEVRKSNVGARALYGKYGFEEVGLRKRYYVDNGEDAIIMTTPHIADQKFQVRLRRLDREHREKWNASGNARAVAPPA